MAKFTDAVKATLKGYFNAGDQPTEAQFASLMDAIQEGIEEHQHDSTGDGDGTGILNGPITMADGAWIGIGAALERIDFDAAGKISVLGADFEAGRAFITTPGSELTLDAAGAITVASSLHRVDTFGDAATDDLVTINGGVSGYILVLRTANNARDVTVKSTGNIHLNTTGDFALSTVNDRITLQFYGAEWYELARSDNA